MITDYECVANNYVESQSGPLSKDLMNASVWYTACVVAECAHSVGFFEYLECFKHCWL